MKNNVKMKRDQQSRKVLDRTYVRHLLTALLMCGGMALAKTPVLNPAQLGAFCPPGSELADAKHTNLISAKDQAEIKRKVHGFMTLDADSRRSGNPKGSSDYWKNGYTDEFNDEKEVPYDGLLYVAYRLANICANENNTSVTILLDVLEMSGKSIDKIYKNFNFFISAQNHFDALTGQRIILPNESSSPKQPLIFTIIPVAKNRGGIWVVEQKKVPKLKKFIKTEWRQVINITDDFHHCSSVTKKNPDYCKRNENRKMLFDKYSRPAWSIYPSNMDSSRK
jgi:hypothetical protein